MSEIKELRSIELASFTTVSTGIAVLFSVISAIILSVVVSLVVPNQTLLLIYLIPTIIVGTLMYTIYNVFFQGFLYNLFAKKLKTIAFAINNNEIIKISTSETATTISLILTIQVILLYLISVLILPLILSSVMNILMDSGQQIIAFEIYQMLMLLSEPATIVLIIFSTFIISFVFILLATYIYNFLAKRGRGAVIYLSEENALTAIDSIDPLKLAIVFSIISGVLNLILAIIMIVSGSPVPSAIGNVLAGFVGGFIEAYLLAVFYNFLATKLGKIKIELIDFKI